MKRYVIAVVGSRSLVHAAGAEDIARGILEHAAEHPKCAGFVSGGARGPDSWAAFVAKHWGVPCTVHKPDWDRHGRRAGFLRNQLIIDSADAVIAFWDGTSKGTLHSINLALGADLPVIIYTWDHSERTYRRRRLTAAERSTP